MVSGSDWVDVGAVPIDAGNLAHRAAVLLGAPPRASS